jgi:acyl-CoA-dependent ceramide synthase
MVIASTYWDAPKHLEFGWWPERGHWATREVLNVFIILLVILEVCTATALWCIGKLIHIFCQVIQSIWSYLIVGVAYRVLRGEGADDSRSDDEG